MAANVMFKRVALRNNLTNVPKTDGNIIIAVDERAMYVDYNVGTSALPDIQRIRLGDFIEVASMSDLTAITTGGTANTSALYYVTDANILCKHDGTKWVQINAQSSITDLITVLRFNTATTAEGATVTQTLGNANTTKSAAFALTSTDLDSLKITSTGNAVAFRAKDVEDNAVLSGTVVPGGASLNIKTSHIGTKADGTAVSTESNGGTIQIVGANGTTVEYDAAGKKITVNGSPITNVSESFAADGTHTTSVTAGGQTKSGSSKPVIVYGDGKSASFASSTATLDVYDKAQTKAQIQEALRASDAMIFRGTIGVGGTITALPTVHVSIGDTYKVTSIGTYAGVACKVGDMLIATAAAGKNENPDGYLTAADIIWLMIPSGDEPTYSVSSTAGDSGTFNILQDGSPIGSLKAGADITFTKAGTVVSIDHRAISTAKTSATGAVFGPADKVTIYPISEVVTSNGHVTEIKTQKVDITRNELSNVANSVSVASNAATVNTVVGMTSAMSKSANFKLTSSNLTVGATGASISMDLQWEDF